MPIGVTKCIDGLQSFHLTSSATMVNYAIFSFFYIHSVPADPMSFCQNLTTDSWNNLGIWMCRICNTLLSPSSEMPRTFQNILVDRTKFQNLSFGLHGYFLSFIFYWLFNEITEQIISRKGKSKANKGLPNGEVDRWWKDSEPRPSCPNATSLPVCSTPV